MGGKLVAATQNVTSFEGAPPAKRVAIFVWDSMDQLQPSGFSGVEGKPRDRRQVREIPCVRSRGRHAVSCAQEEDQCRLRAACFSPLDQESGLLEVRIFQPSG